MAGASGQAEGHPVAMARAASVDREHRRILRLVPAARRWLAVAVGAGLGAAVLLVLHMLLLSWIVRDVLFRHETLGQVAPLVLLTACALAARAGFIALREAGSRQAAIRAKADLRERLAAHILRLGPGYACGERTGNLVTAATDGIEMLDAYVSRYLPQRVLGVAVPIVIVLAILPVDPLSAGLLVFTVPVIVMLMILIGTFTQDHVQRQWEALGRLSSGFLDIIQGLPTLLLLDQDGRERRRVEAISERFRDRTLGVLKIAFISGAVLELMTAAGIGLIATILGVRLLAGGISFDRAFFVFLLTPEFYRPLRELGNGRHAVIEGAAAADRILEILETPAVGETGNQGMGASAAEVVPGRITGRVDKRGLSIELEDVSYIYPGRRQPALSHLSLSLAPGTCTAVVGASGAGKTTLVNLLLRSMDPSGGAIRANGELVSALPVDAWRAQLALVPQRPYLFTGTVRDNIRLARPAATDEEVRQAAALAGCLTFISELPGGLDSLIGERGEGLSAGQRQRLAMARAFLKDAPFLVLDEPTSALDPESEQQIRRSLSVLMQTRTVLVVAHRLNTVRAAQRVVVLSGGRLVEAGEHEELWQRGGVYAALMGGGQRVAEEVA